MRIDVVTLFPEMVEHAARFGITGRACERGLWRLGTWNPRDFATDNHRTVDDRPYGGGPGMVMMAEPLGAGARRGARRAARATAARAPRVIYLSPAGAPLTHRRVMELAAAPDAGYVRAGGPLRRRRRAPGRARVDEEIAIGDFVVSGGELPALMLIDAMARQLPGALNDARVGASRSRSRPGLLDCPHYTRPESLDGLAVPAVLLSGNHAAIARWRHAAGARPDGDAAARTCSPAGR